MIWFSGYLGRARKGIFFGVARDCCRAKVGLAFYISQYPQLLIMGLDHGLYLFPTLFSLSKLSSYYEGRISIHSSLIIPFFESPALPFNAATQRLCLPIPLATCAASNDPLLYSAASFAVDSQKELCKQTVPQISEKRLQSQHGSNHTDHSSSGQVWESYQHSNTVSSPPSRPIS